MLSFLTDQDHCVRYTCASDSPQTLKPRDIKPLGLPGEHNECLAKNVPLVLSSLTWSRLLCAMLRVLVDSPQGPPAPQPAAR